MPPLIISPAERHRWLNSHVPYRIEMLRGLNRYLANGEKNGPFKPVFPSIFESALIACRWTAYFLGLRLKDASLRQVKKNENKTAVHVDDLGGVLINPSALPSSERDLLALVIKGASVATAHPTREGIHKMTHLDVFPAAELLIQKVKIHLYDELKLPVPILKW